MISLEDNVAVITDAAEGNGAATERLLSTAGAASWFPTSTSRAPKRLPRRSGLRGTAEAVLHRHLQRGRGPRAHREGGPDLRQVDILDKTTPASWVLHWAQTPRPISMDVDVWIAHTR